jgi:hypothetical protein
MSLLPERHSKQNKEMVEMAFENKTGTSHTPGAFNSAVASNGISTPQLRAAVKGRVIAPDESHPLVRVVGEPSSPEAAIVAPTLEDAYLLLTHDLLKR